MGESGVRVFRPIKLLAILMGVISLGLMIASLAGPDWMEVHFFQGEIKSWGLWWECFRIKVSFEMCVQADWLAACAALVVIAFICIFISTVLGCIGLFTHRRFLYVTAGTLSIFAVVVQIISLIIYPVKFTDEVKHDPLYKAETQKFDLDWTYGVAWGAVFFMIGAAILFLIRTENQEVIQKTNSTPPPYYMNYS